jgi:hypothetical protein
MTPDYTFCTIVTRSYLRGAAALAEGLARHHPETTLQTLVVDPGPDMNGLDGMMVPYGLDALGLDAAAEMTGYYDAHSLSNNLKPFFMRFLARQGHRKVIFLDSDIMVTNPLSGVLALLERHAFLLTPHLLDAARSDLGEVALDVMADYGAYNGGFIAVRADATGMAVLDWLCARLTKTSLRFADQKVLTLCAQLFADDFLCLRDPTCNVAYWNLHERDLVLRDGQCFVGAAPLTFFHFSGYRFDQPGRFSAHSHRGVAGNAALAALLTAYDEAIARYAHLRHDSYGYGHRDGRRMTADLRAYFFRHGTLDGYRRANMARLAQKLSAIALRRS